MPFELPPGDFRGPDQDILLGMQDTRLDHQSPTKGTSPLRLWHNILCLNKAREILMVQWLMVEKKYHQQAILCSNYK